MSNFDTMTAMASGHALARYAARPQGRAVERLRVHGHRSALLPEFRPGRRLK